MRNFDDLVVDAESVDVSGWDFSWLDGRTTEYDTQLISVHAPEWREILDRIKVATRLSSQLSAYSMDDPQPDTRAA
ncbi:MAG TPA: hypothetical protein VIY28_16870 [Pseudonocardiaceae bacterium]